MFGSCIIGFCVAQVMHVTHRLCRMHLPIQVTGYQTAIEMSYLLRLQSTAFRPGISLSQPSATEPVLISAPRLAEFRPTISRVGIFDHRH